MTPVLRRLLVLLLFVHAGAALALDIKPYIREDLASDVVRLSETLRKETSAIGARLRGLSPEQLRKEVAAAIVAKNFKDAISFAGAAIIANPKDAASWLGLARVAATADDAQADNRYDMVTRGQTAAYAAYQRATAPPAQAEALALLGNLFAAPRATGVRRSTPMSRASQRRDNEDVPQDL